MHKCIRCGTIYEDNDSTILRGCNKCGAIFFLHIRDPADVKQLHAVEKELEKKDTTLEKELKKQIEKKKKVKEPKPPKEKPIKEKEIKRVRKEVIKIGERKYAVEDLFGVETVRIPKDGVYEINIDALMKKRPVVVLEQKQVYFIYLPLLFEELGER